MLVLRVVAPAPSANFVTITLPVWMCHTRVRAISVILNAGTFDKYANVPAGDCETMCAQQHGCVAFEVGPHTCEIHSEPIVNVHAEGNCGMFLCFSKSPQLGSGA